MSLAALAVAAVLFLVGALSLLLGRKNDHPATDWKVDQPAEARRDTVAYVGRCLAVAPIAAVGLLLIRAFIGPLLLNAPTPTASTGEAVTWLVIGVVLTVVIAPATSFGLAAVEKAWLRDGMHAKGLGIALLLVTLPLGVWAAIQPETAGSYLRVIGLLTIALAGFTVVLGAVQRQVELRPPALVFGRWKRTPIATLGLVTVLLALQLDNGRYHDVAVTTGTMPPPAAAAGIDDAFQAWLTAIEGCAPQAEAVPGGWPTVPLVLVAAPGGGIRAAYWTAAALESLVPRSAPCGHRPIFAISGVSGGSVGAAVWAAQRRDSTVGTSLDPARDLSREEPLAALLAAMLYRDFPRTLHGVNGHGGSRIADRARVFEESWEQTYSPLSRDMMTTAPQAGDDLGWRPLLLMNGTAAESGCRVVVAPVPAAVTHRDTGPVLSCQSAAGIAHPDGEGNVQIGPARFAPGALDARDYLGRDGDAANDCYEPPAATLRLSTAALLSARFPYITPTGSLVHCLPAGADGAETVRSFNVDGGYLENNGIALTLNLWRSLEPMVADHNARATVTGRPLVAPMLAVLDNHYQSVAAPSPPRQIRELSAPVKAFLAPHQAQTDPVLLQDAFISFSGALPGLPRGRLRVGDTTCEGVRVFRAAPDEHPGVEAPLGWVLSEWAQADLRLELDRQVRGPDACAATAGNLSVHPAGIATILRLLAGPLSFQPT